MTPTLLYLLPGLLCDARMWTPQIAGLSDLAEIRVADFRALDDFTDMANAVLNAADRPFALAGHSMGARVALQIVHLAPERVERLALLDTGVHGTRDHESDSRGALVHLGETEGMAAVTDQWLPPMLHPDHRGPGALLTDLRAMVGSMAPATYAGQTRALLGRQDARPWLADIHCPTLIGVGRDDQWSPVFQHEEIAAAIPQSRLVIFEHAGHMAPREAPEAVTAAMRAWLTDPA